MNFVLKTLNNNHYSLSIIARKISCGDDTIYISTHFSGCQVDGLVALMEGEHVGPFNLGNPGEFTMLELAEVCPG